ncbi:MAG: hypothetical protein V4547_18875 [Bacteroidota bacterium]
MQIPNFHTKEEKFKFLKDHKQDLIASKKYQPKHADAICYGVPLSNSKGEAVKSDSTMEGEDVGILKALVVINTTNILDSHGDVHIPGLWNKSLKEVKNMYLLQEHRMTFDKIIADSLKNNLKASVKNYEWSKLGFPEYEGKTQALVFDSEIDSNRNAYMFEQYRKGYVTEHSVGMQYVNMFLCINSTEKYFVEEKQNWDKYISEVANKQDAINEGNFWAVTEAKLIEGSAVVRGSNFATPTISISNTTESGKSTTEEIEPLNSTQKQVESVYYLVNNLNLK